MDATGEGDADIWRGIVKAGQDEHLQPAADRLLRVVVASLGLDPAEWYIELPPLKQESAMDIATRRKVIADTDAVYVSNEVYTPEEIALVRVKAGEWTDHAPDIDEEAREAREAMVIPAPLEGEEERAMPAGVPDEVLLAAPAAGSAGAPVAGDAAKAAYNGAQMASMQGIIQAVANGELPGPSAIEMLLTGFPIDRAAAERMVDPAVAKAAEEAAKPKGVQAPPFTAAE